jgi:hypothetical protein
MMQAIDVWMCPWCFVVPFVPPKAHKCRKNAETLKNTVLCDALSSQIEDKIEAILDRKLKGVLQTTNADVNQKLSSLETKIDRIISTPATSPQQPTTTRATYTPPPPEIPPSTDAGPVDISLIKPVEPLQKDFLNDDSLGDLRRLLASVDYAEKNGRDTATFGSKYKFMGSDETPKPIPPVLQNVLDELNKTTSVDKDPQKKYKLNSCQV